MHDVEYKGSTISLRTQAFGNGTAVEVHVDGNKVLDLYDARALYATEEEALRQGTQFGRDCIDGQASAVGADRGERRGGTSVKSHNPGDHGTDRG